MDVLALNFDKIVGSILEYFLLLAGIGTLSMAFLELAKGLTSLKRRFHQRVLRSWLAIPSLPNASKEKQDDNADRTETLRQEFALLTTGAKPVSTAADVRIGYSAFGLKRSDAVYALDLEQVVAKAQSAFEAALQQPSRYPEMFKFISDEVTAHEPDESSTTVLDWFSKVAPSEFKEHNKNSGGRVPTSEEQQRAYNLLHASLTRRLDILQISAGYTWKRFNRIMSVLIGAGLLWYVLDQSQSQLCNNREGICLDTVDMIFLSLFGGVLAPVSKDVVAAIGKLRGP